MTWQWRDGTAWRDFDPGLAAQLDRAREAGQATCVYSFRGQPYEVDFQQNTQVNKNTGFARDVRRLGDLASPAVEGQVVSGRMGFLYDAREDLKAGLRTETGKKNQHERRLFRLPPALYQPHHLALDVAG